MRSALYLGRRRQGKSTLAFHHALQQKGGIVVFDINAQFRDCPGVRTSDLAEFDTLVSNSQERIVIFRPARNVNEEFGAFCECLWKRQGYTLLIDEASQVQSAAGCNEWLDRFMRMAPPELKIFQTLHRPRDSATLCRSLATDWFIFRTTLPRDLDVIEEQCGEEARVRVAGFEEGSRVFYHWDDSLGKGEIIDHPESWKEVI